MFEFERSIQALRQKRKAEFDEEEQAWFQKRQAARLAWEKQCKDEIDERLARWRREDQERAYAEEAQRQKMAEAERRHQASLQEMVEKQRRTLQQERDDHEARLAELIEQASAAQAQLDARAVAPPLTACTALALPTSACDKDDLKAKLKEKTSLCRQLSTHSLETPPASAKAPSPASSTRPSPSVTPPPQLPNPDAAAMLPADAPVGINMAFNSSTHPAAWGAIYRMTRQKDCAEDIKKAWDAGLST